MITKLMIIEIMIGIIMIMLNHLENDLWCRKLLLPHHNHVSVGQTDALLLTMAS